jgi:hypothetical protein
MHTAVSLRHFLANRTERWFMRCDDDAMINARGVARLVASMEARFDPLKDFAAAGHCKCSWLERGYNIPLPQGGGWLVSRRLAEEMVEHHQSCNQTVTEAEDDWLGFFWQGRVPAENVSNVFIPCDSRARLLTWNARLSKCEEKPKSFGCPCPWTRAVRFQDVAVFHSVKTREMQQRVATAFVEAKFAIQSGPLGRSAPRFCSL